MKKIILTIALLTGMISASAQTEYSILRACHPDDVKHYDTEQLRSHFMTLENAEIMGNPDMFRTW